MLEEYLGDLTFDDIIIDDLLVPSYSFNARSPRFFSKYFLKINPGFYNVQLK